MHSAEQIFGQANPWARSRGTADYLRDMTSGMTHEERLAQVRWLAGVMDDAFHVPGTRLRFGWDSILGLFPGLGDVLTSALSLLIVHHAWQTGASKLTLARMLGNIGVDFVVGSVAAICSTSCGRRTARTRAFWSSICTCRRRGTVGRRCAPEAAGISPSLSLPVHQLPRR